MIVFECDIIVFIAYYIFTYLFNMLTIYIVYINFTKYI